MAIKYHYKIKSKAMNYLELLQSSGFSFFSVGNNIAIDNYFATKHEALSILKKIAKYVFIGSGISPIFVARYGSKGNTDAKVLHYRYIKSGVQDVPHQYPFDLSDNAHARYD